MSKAPKYKQLAEKEYRVISTLQDAGLSGTKISEVTGRSIATISYIKRSTSFDDYHALTRRANEKSNANKLARAAAIKEEPATTPVPTKQPVTDDKSVQVLLEKISDIYEVLHILNDKLDRVAVPTRRFGR